MLNLYQIKTRMTMPNTPVSANPPAAETPAVESDAVRILVVGSLTPPDIGDYLKSVLRAFSESAFSSVRRGRGEVNFVDASTPDRAVDTALDGMDGLLVLGGADADPTCYGQRLEADTTYGIDPQADRFELALLREAGARDLPVLGICRGMQLINIMHGGDLVQEIGQGTVHNGTFDNSIMVSHPVTLEPGSRLDAIYGGRTLSVRSGHHQAVSRVGEGLAVTARAEDGMVEAVETTGPNWMVGVQWHPEDPEAPRADLDLLMAGFINVARQRRRA